MNEGLFRRIGAALSSLGMSTDIRYTVKGVRLELRNKNHRNLNDVTVTFEGVETEIPKGWVLVENDRYQMFIPESYQRLEDAEKIYLAGASEVPFNIVQIPTSLVGSIMDEIEYYFGKIFCIGGSRPTRPTVTTTALPNGFILGELKHQWVLHKAIPVYKDGVARNELREELKHNPPSE